MKLTENQVLAIKRKRGELNMSIRGLERATGVSRWTLIDIFKHDHRNVNSKTFKKLNDWLIASNEDAIDIKIFQKPNILAVVLGGGKP